MPGHARGAGWHVEFLHRLRALDQEVGQLQAAVAALQRHLAYRAAAPPGAVRGGDDYLRAYA